MSAELRQRQAPEGAEGAERQAVGFGARFWRLFAASGISSLGDGMVLVAFPLLALTLTSRPLLIAGVAMADRLPFLVLAIPAGALADRVDRRRLVAATNLARVVVLAAFSGAVVAGSDSLPLLYATVFLLGSGQLVFDAAAQACLPAMVDPADLPGANSYLTSAQLSGEQFAGPAFGGLLFAASASVPFLIDAASFAGSTVLLNRALPPGKPSSASSGFVDDIREGLRWFLGHKVLRPLAVMVGSLAFCQAMVLAELALYGTHQLHLTRTAYGVFFATIACGNVVGALIAGRVHARFGPARCIVTSAVIPAVAYLALGASRSLALATLAMFLESVAVALGNVCILSLRQQIVPAELLGRVGTSFRMFIVGLIPLGALTGGLLATGTSVRGAFEIAGVLQLLLLAVTVPQLLQKIGQYLSPAPTR